MVNIIVHNNIDHAGAALKILYKDQFV